MPFSECALDVDVSPCGKDEFPLLPEEGAQAEPFTLVSDVAEMTFKCVTMI